MVGLIGYTGTVGSHLTEQYIFDELYNSKNINDIKNKYFDVLFVAGIRAAKYIANKNPEEDISNIKSLIDKLKSVTVNKLILISTIDVHNNDHYGNNRLFAEQEISKMFDTTVVRLPGLVGKYIKKNFIYDICHDNDLSFTSINSEYEFMNLEDLHKFIDMALFNNIKLLEIRSEPIQVKEICHELKIDSSLLNDTKGVKYKHEGINFYNRDEELDFIKDYVQSINITNK